MRTLRIYSLYNFPVYHTALLTIVIILYIISVVLIYLTTGSLYLLTAFLQFLLSPPLVTTNLISFSMSLYLLLLLFQIPQISKIIRYLSFSVLLHLTLYAQGPSMLSQMSAFPHFLWLNNIPLYRYSTISLSIHPSMDTQAVFVFWLSQFCYEHGGADIFPSQCFHFLWIYPQK